VDLSILDPFVKKQKTKNKKNKPTEIKPQTKNKPELTGQRAPAGVKFL
jgi:hypothetical protein